MFDITDSYAKLFNRFNSKVSDNGEEVLDKEEIQKAKQAGFNLFELKENMTEDEFFDAYLECAPLDENSEEAVQFEKKVNDIHVKYLQIQYKSNEQIRPDESMDAFEHRLSAMNSIKDAKYTDKDRKMFNNAINNPNDVEAVVNANYHFNTEEPYSPVYNCINDLMEKYQAALEDFLGSIDPSDYDTLQRVLGGGVYSAGKRADSDIKDALAVLSKYPESDGSKYAKIWINRTAEDIKSQQ